MAILKGGKANWKYILIVFISAAIVGGGILGYRWWVEKQVRTEPELEIPKGPKKEEEIGFLENKEPEKEKTFTWKEFWEETGQKGCYDDSRQPEALLEYLFPSREYIDWYDYPCPDIQDFASQNPTLHQNLLNNEGAIEEWYQGVWDCRKEDWLSSAIYVGHIDITGDGKDDAVVLYRGGAAMRSHAVGIFQGKDEDYLKILDKDIQYSSFEIENGKVVEVLPMYLFGEPLCCPSNYTHIYYQSIDGRLKIDKVMDNFGLDITEIYSTLRSCTYEEVKG